MMGAGIAYASARSGIDVVLLDRTNDDAAKGKGYSQRLMEKALSRGKSTDREAQALLDRISPTDNYADLADCDLIIEAVFEDRQIKADVTQKSRSGDLAGQSFCNKHLHTPYHGLSESFLTTRKFHRHTLLLSS